MRSIKEPNKNDVLLGRSFTFRRRPGNQNYVALIKQYRKACWTCPKMQRSRIARLIYDEIRSMKPPGRFLKPDLKSKLWWDIGEDKALDKTRRALVQDLRREGKLRKLIEAQAREADQADNKDGKAQLGEGIKPNENDVLVGGEGLFRRHPGNENYAALVKQHKKEFLMCRRSRKQRRRVARQIYNEIRSMEPPGRFLKPDPKSKRWWDIDEKEALEKTYRALLNQTLKWRKLIAADHANDDGKDDYDSVDNDGSSNDDYDDSNDKEWNGDAPPGQQPSLDFVDLSDIFTSFSSSRPAPRLVEPSREFSSVDGAPRSQQKMPFTDSHNNHSNIATIQHPSRQDFAVTNFGEQTHDKLQSNKPPARLLNQNLTSRTPERLGPVEPRPNNLSEPSHYTIGEASPHESTCETISLMDILGTSRSNSPVLSPAGRNVDVHIISSVGVDAIMAAVERLDRARYGQKMQLMKSAQLRLSGNNQSADHDNVMAMKLNMGGGHNWAVHGS